MQAGCKSICAASAVTLVFVLCSLLSVGPTAAQKQSNDNESLVIPGRKRPKPTPTPTPTRRKSRTTKPRPPQNTNTQTPTQLSLKWRLLKVNEDDGVRQAIIPSDQVSWVLPTFALRDRLALNIIVTQNGYLYVIRQSSPGSKGKVLFPTRYYNEGKPAVQANQEFILPSNCRDINIACWFSLQPPAGKEILTVIFSRHEIMKLPQHDYPNAAAQDVDSLVLTGLLSDSQQQRLERIGATHPLPPIPGMVVVAGDRRERVVSVENVNKDIRQELLVETLTLNKAASVNTASATPKD